MRNHVTIQKEVEEFQSNRSAVLAVCHLSFLRWLDSASYGGGSTTLNESKKVTHLGTEAADDNLNILDNMSVFDLSSMA